MTDTIFALATAPGRSAVAVVRLSGPAAGKALGALAGALPAPRRASLRRLSQPRDGVHLDDGIVLWFPAPRSYTGEDGAELHLHGGPAVVDGVTRALVDLGIRPAEPGEFTRRAFENGRLDLAQAEAVADLADAETQAQRAQALGQLGGALSRRYAEWREALVEALALLEAAVDFPDEDLPEALAARAAPKLDALAHGLRTALEDSQRGERVRSGFNVALVGAPNAGKSSLLNALAGRDMVIVAAQAGTTRDVVEAPMTVQGYKVVVADMAGLRATAEPVEAEGVRRARVWAEAADLRIWVADGAASDGGWKAVAELIRPGDLCLINKVDLGRGPDRAGAQAAALQAGARVVEGSATEPEGLNGLEAALAQAITAGMGGGEFPAVTRSRHLRRLQEALAHLDRARAVLAEPELAAEDLRLASRALARIAGRVDSEDVLDVVFASFCIGK